MTKPTTNGLDLDALIKEVEEAPRFTFTFLGKEWSLLHPEHVDWQVAEDLEPDSPRAVLSAYLGAEQYAEFSEHNVPISVVNQLMEAANVHYAVVPPGESDGLPTS